MIIANTGVLLDNHDQVIQALQTYGDSRILSLNANELASLANMAIRNQKIKNKAMGNKGASSTSLILLFVWTIVIILILLTFYITK